MDPLRACYAGIKNYYRNVLLSTSLCRPSAASALMAQRLPGRPRDPKDGSGSCMRISYGSLYIYKFLASMRVTDCSAIAANARNVNKYAACSHIVQDAA
jgi:hypothetical protein